MATCWRCGQDTGGALFCLTCQAIQPPPEDPFQLLGIPPRLGLDVDDLQKRFYALSRVLHPDRYARATPQERQYATDGSARLNDAFRSLRQPVSRAELFLRQQGLEASEQRGKDVPPELLEEVFELNMALEELRGGDADARPQLESARTRFAAMLAESDSLLERQFHEYDQAPGPAPLTEIRSTLNRRRYIENLIRDVNAALV